jgi:hypothetical protein
VTKYLNRKILALVLVVTWTLSPAFGQLQSALNSGPQPINIVGTHRPVGELWAKTDLYFGTSKPDGGVVSDDDFKRFLDTVVTPRFPDGLTLLSGFGQFRNSKGTIIQEKSFVLILLYPPPTGDSSKKIEEIRSIYKEMFKQESVLRVDSAGLVSF